METESKSYLQLSPTIGGSFSYAWRKIFGSSFLYLLLSVFILMLLRGPMGFTWKTDTNTWMNLIHFMPATLLSLAYSLLFLSVLTYGKTLLFLKAMRNESVDLHYLFVGFKSKYLKIILANFIACALILIGFVLLIIPGIIVACRLVFVPFLIMDKEIEPMEAIEKSWKMTKGHGWKIFLMGILSFFIIIAGLIAFFVGVIISAMWISAAFATLYQSVLNESGEENPIPILGVNED